MRKILCLIFTVIVLCVFVACSNGGGSTGNNNGEYDDVASAELTTTGLNNLRQAVGGDWGYAFVARDCIFNEYGYYKFEDVLEYNISRAGEWLGLKEDREVYFTRDDSSVYGIYVGGKQNGSYVCYSFIADYETADIEFDYFGRFDVAEVYVSKCGSDSTAYVLIDDWLILYDFNSFRIVAKEQITYGYEYPAEALEFFKKGNTAVLFSPNEEIKTHIYTYENGGFSKVESRIDYSMAEYPYIAYGCYMFSVNDEDIYSLDGDVDLDNEQLASAKAEYTEYVNNANGDKVIGEDYEIAFNNGAVTVKRISDDEERSFTASPIYSLAEISAIISARDNTFPEITSVKISGGEIFVVLELEPDIFEVLRDVNDGIPQVVVKYDFDTQVFSFCGLVDFTGYSIYRIVKL